MWRRNSVETEMTAGLGHGAVGWLKGEQSHSRAIEKYFVVFFQQERHLEDLLSSAGEGREAILSEIWSTNRLK